MGASASVHDRDAAVLLCKERLRYMKQAVDSRYALSAGQLSYEQSLRSLGAALTRFAGEAAESSSSPPAEASASPSHSSYLSLSQSPLTEPCCSSTPSPSPLKLAGVSYVKSARSPAVKVIVGEPPESHFIREEQCDVTSSWDFFSPVEPSSVARRPELLPPPEFLNPSIADAQGDDGQTNAVSTGAEKEDGFSEYVARRAKNMVSSMRDVEHRFIRAAESCHEVSRMLETNKIQLTVSSVTIGKPSLELIAVLSALLICCKARTAEANESEHNAAKVITWKRSVSSRSSASSRNPLIAPSKDDHSECGSSDFVEEFSMISGSHSSTLDRLYAWERKLSDELKATETLRKAYDQKCRLLRYQFARDMDARVVDRTRAAIKDLRSRLLVATQSLDAISKRIERLRDAELHPQLKELLQGLTRMWRAVLECHHAQHITVSLAYNARPAAAERAKQGLADLRGEVECFRSSFANWLDAHRCYVEALNLWLQKCVLPSKESGRGRRASSPRRYISPPIFALLQSWAAGTAAVPTADAYDSLESLAKELGESCKEKKQAEESKQAEKQEVQESLQAGLTAVFDRLMRLAESMVKMYEDVRRDGETAEAAYAAASR